VTINLDDQPAYVPARSRSRGRLPWLRGEAVPRWSGAEAARPASPSFTRQRQRPRKMRPKAAASWASCFPSSRIDPSKNEHPVLSEPGGGDHCQSPGRTRAFGRRPSCSAPSARHQAAGSRRRFSVDQLAALKVGLKTPGRFDRQGIRSGMRGDHATAGPICLIIFFSWRSPIHRRRAELNRSSSRKVVRGPRPEAARWETRGDRGQARGQVRHESTAA